MKLTEVIRRPLVTEKTTLLREDARTVVFEVATAATKVDIKRAVEKLLGSKVEGVRTAIAHGKFKRQGRFIGQRSDWKKALREARARARRFRSSWRGIRKLTLPLALPAEDNRDWVEQRKAGSGKQKASEASAIRASCQFANTIRRRRAGGSRPSRCSTRSRRPSRISR